MNWSRVAIVARTDLRQLVGEELWAGQGAGGDLQRLGGLWGLVGQPQLLHPARGDQNA